MMQERKSVANAGLRVRRLTGDDIKPSHWEAFYQGYINTTGDLSCSASASLSPSLDLLLLGTACGWGGSM